MRGIMLVGGILLLAAILSGFAWWHQWHRGRGALEFWGTEAAFVVRVAKQVECWILTSDAGRALNIPPIALPSGQTRYVAQATDAADWGGLVHLRQALIDDPSYVSFTADRSVIERTHAWDIALRFTAGEREAVVVFDVESGCVYHVRGGRIAQLNDFVATGLRNYLQDRREKVVTDGPQELKPIAVYDLVGLRFDPL
ncbi:MAG: hypothetical protein O2931_01850 [Planctomycetota bacterium]|nr:hypothetical protein [Planctomycetota bacterium]MDA1177517.1 hypothetical protein [Planctomycetota bacterium]